MHDKLYPIHYYISNDVTPVTANGIQIASQDGWGIIIAEDGVMPMFSGKVPPKSDAQKKFNALAQTAAVHGKAATIEMYRNGSYQEFAE